MQRTGRKCSTLETEFDQPGAARPILVRAWDAAATGYTDYFAPRFRPFSDRALTALTRAALPEGPVLVPCCGPGLEVGALAAALPHRPVIGIDFSEEMVRIGAAQHAGVRSVSFASADATTLSRTYRGVAGILSCFGLQLLPDPAQALADWVQTLSPGGVLSVIFWPLDNEETGPFADFRRIAATRSQAPAPTWEGQLAGALTGAGATLEHDEEIALPMTHPSRTALWDAMLHSGPMRALAMKAGEEFVTSFKAEFMQRADDRPADDQPILHTPRARWIVARRTES